MDSHPASLAISVSCIYYQRATFNSQMTKHQPEIPKHSHVAGMSNIESFGVGSIRTFTCRSSSTTTVSRIWGWNRSNVATDDGGLFQKRHVVLSRLRQDVSNDQT